jgi:enterochelin esterase family protein
MRGNGPDAKYDPQWDWYAQNLKMAQALTEKRYDVAYVWGVGSHSNKHGGAVMPEMLRWLWRDHRRGDPAMDPAQRTPLGPSSASAPPQSEPAPER